MPTLERRCGCRPLGGCAWCTILTIDDAALAVDRSAATIRAWIRGIRGRRLAAHHLGAMQFVLEADLLAFERDTRRAAEASRWTTL